MKRAVIIVLDGVGIGELPDAAFYGDTGSNTLINIKKAVPQMKLKNMVDMGIGKIEGAGLLGATSVATASYGRMTEVSNGKDTTTGHWEICGLHIEKAFPTYHDGFPDDFIQRFESAINRKCIGNYPSSGTEIIQKLGDKHVATGFPIVYTSADSVFQIAAHEELIPVSQLYEMCETARLLLTGEHAVARVIARPFIGKAGEYTRTKNRRDFSLAPFSDTLLDVIKNSGRQVAAVGKIEDIFAARGMTDVVHTKSNNEGIDRTIDYLKSVGEGLIITNLVDYDMLYGHRNDTEGFASALDEFDLRLPEIIDAMLPDDILFITADHGCDPTTPSTDHSREYAPLLVFGMGLRSVDLGTLSSFSDISATIMEYFELDNRLKGQSFLQRIFAR